eukprot:4461234-Alexandrium_andersonii.AAC.1
MRNKESWAGLLHASDANGRKLFAAMRSLLVQSSYHLVLIMGCWQSVCAVACCFEITASMLVLCTPPRC